MLDTGYWAKKGKKLHYVEGEAAICGLPATSLWRVVFPEPPRHLSYCAKCCKGLDERQAKRGKFTDSGQFTLPLGG